jgi:hypothetical protein
MRARVMHKLLIALTLVSTTVAAAPASAARPLKWSAPRLIDQVRPFSNLLSLGAISCPSASLCVAADEDGNLVSSGQPSGGSSTWHAAMINGVSCGDSNSCPASDLSCPADSFCAATDQQYVVVSSDPSSPSGAWRTVRVDPGHRLQAISCPTTTDCVAADDAGSVIASTDPADGAAAWKVAAVNHGRGLTGISCPSTSLCVAVDGTGRILSSRDPTGGAQAWSAAEVNGRPTRVACPTTTLCVAVGNDGNVTSSSDPAGGAGTWAEVGPIASYQCGYGEHMTTCTDLVGITCASSSLCFALDGGGNLYVSSRPNGTASDWRLLANQPGALGGGYGVNGISCPSTSLCVTSGFGSIAFSTSPEDGAWTAVEADGFNALQGVSCPSRFRCVAVDDNQHVFVSSDPAGGARTWTPHLVPSTMQSLSCPAISLCVGVSASPTTVLSGVLSGNPTGGSANWHATPLARAQFGTIACRSTSLCVAAGEAHVAVSRSPRTGRWSVFRLGVGTLGAAACGSRSLCLAAGAMLGTDDGVIATSTNPTRSGSWKVNPVDGHNTLLAASCPGARLCVLLDNNGNVLTSRTPAAGAKAWKRAKVDSAHAGLSSVSCPTTSSCVAVDSLGNVLWSSNPAGGARAWSRRHIDDGQLEGVSCASASLCVAVDRSGRLLYSSRTHVR